MGAEAKLYKKLKAYTPQIIWNRIENLSLPGMPDLLGYNNSGTFFTVELKVTKGRKLRFSPHQIAFHVQHPLNTFIHESWSLSLVAWRLTLAAWGLRLVAWSSNRLVLEAWRLQLGAFFSPLSTPRNILGVWIPLMFAVTNIRNRFCPTLSALFTLAALRWSRAAGALSHDWWCMSPGRWRWSVNLASR